MTTSLVMRVNTRLEILLIDCSFSSSSSSSSSFSSYFYSFSASSSSSSSSSTFSSSSSFSSPSFSSSSSSSSPVGHLEVGYYGCVSYGASFFPPSFLLSFRLSLSFSISPSPFLSFHFVSFYFTPSSCASPLAFFLPFPSALHCFFLVQ